MATTYKLSELNKSILSSSSLTKSRPTETLRKFYGCLKDEDFPSAEEIKKVINDNDKDIENWMTR